MNSSHTIGVFETEADALEKRLKGYSDAGTYKRNLPYRGFMGFVYVNFDVCMPADVVYHIGSLVGREAERKRLPFKAIGNHYTPTVVCLCGSTRFMEAFQQANLSETLAGRIVLSVGCNTKSDVDLLAAGEMTPALKAELDELHKRKIDLADEVLVLNVGGYIGESTRSEVEYALAHGKVVRWLEPHATEGQANA